MGFISVTKSSTLAQKVIGRPNAAWNSVSESLPILESLILDLVHVLNCVVHVMELGDGVR